MFWRKGRCACVPTTDIEGSHGKAKAHEELRVQDNGTIRFRITDSVTWHKMELRVKKTFECVKIRNIFCIRSLFLV